MSLLPAPYSPDTYVPSLNGKVIIITGADGGLGYETLIHVARYSPSKLVLCARSKEKYDNTLEGIVVAVPGPVLFIQYLELDLASLSSVQEAAKAFITDNDRLDVLMNNAGIMAQPAALRRIALRSSLVPFISWVPRMRRPTHVPDITVGSCPIYEAPASVAQGNSH